jgi:predicted nucleic acid-binding protein
LNCIVDTSVWSLSLRRETHRLNPTERSIVTELSELIDEGRVRLIGLIRQEILSGIRTSAQFEKLRLYLRSFQDVPIDISDHESAAEASNRCKEKGMTASVVDTLICAVALNRDWTIFSTDTDFQRFAAILSVKLHAPRK